MSNVSDFFVTLNTNQRYPSHDTDEARKLRRVWKEKVVPRIAHRYLRFPHGGSTIDVASIEDYSAIEFGPERALLHLHAMVRVRHNLKMVWLNIPRLRKTVSRRMNLNNVYINIQTGSLPASWKHVANVHKLPAQTNRDRVHRYIEKDTRVDNHTKRSRFDKR